MVSEEASHEAPDHAQIMRVIQLYMEGWKNSADKFREAFHEDAWIFFTDSRGKPHNYLLADGFENWAKTNWEIVSREISIKQMGDIASVTLQFDNITDPSAVYVDMLNLIRIDGDWKITNKTATHVSRINQDA